MSEEFKTIKEQLDKIERLTLIGAKAVLDLKEAALYTGLSVGHLYRLTSTKQIPHSKKSRKLYFEKARLDRWMLENDIPTEQEIETQAQTYIAISKHKRKRG